MCLVCGKKNFGKKYRINGHDFLICRDCLKVLKYNIMEMCPNCGRMSLVPTDKANEVPAVINCLCGKCMEE